MDELERLQHELDEFEAHIPLMRERSLGEWERPYVDALAAFVDQTRRDIATARVFGLSYNTVAACQEIGRLTMEHLAEMMARALPDLVERLYEFRETA